MISATDYPLTWPLKRPRTRNRVPGRFRVSLNRALDDLADEIARHVGSTGGRGERWLLSSNVPVRRDGWPYASAREPDDPGVALYLTRNGTQYVLACDTYTTVAANVRAVSKTLEALRAIERHGSSGLSEQAYSGFAMLGAVDWRRVLGVNGNATIEHVTRCYRRLVAECHPDRGGDPARFREIVAAFEAAKGEL